MLAWPGEAFLMGIQEYQALLGTPHAKEISRMVIKLIDIPDPAALLEDYQ